MVKLNIFLLAVIAIILKYSVADKTINVNKSDGSHNLTKRQSGWGEVIPIPLESIPEVPVFLDHHHHNHKAPCKHHYVPHSPPHVPHHPSHVSQVSHRPIHAEHRPTHVPSSPHKAPKCCCCCEDLIEPNILCQARSQCSIPEPDDKPCVTCLHPRTHLSPLVALQKCLNPVPPLIPYLVKPPHCKVCRQPLVIPTLLPPIIILRRPTKVTLAPPVVQTHHHGHESQDHHEQGVSVPQPLAPQSNPGIIGNLPLRPLRPLRPITNGIQNVLNSVSSAIGLRKTHADDDIEAKSDDAIVIVDDDYDYAEDLELSKIDSPATQ